jgi:hypothetical protein
MADHDENVTVDEMIPSNHKPFHVQLCIEGELEPMSQITATVTLVVNPATETALTFTPNANLQPETEGVDDPGQVLGTVSGGQSPYTFSATGVPSGDSLAQQASADGNEGDVDVVISGTPSAGDSAGSPYSIVLTITDSAANPATLKKTITVKR